LVLIIHKINTVKKLHFVKYLVSVLGTRQNDLKYSVHGTRQNLVLGSALPCCSRERLWV